MKYTRWAFKDRCTGEVITKTRLGVYASYYEEIALWKSRQSIREDQKTFCLEHFKIVKAVIEIKEAA